MLVQTSADRGPILAGKIYNHNTTKAARSLVVCDLRIRKNSKTGLYEGDVYLHDTKTASRDRTDYLRLDHPWNKVREEANLEHVRFKDLRAHFSTYAEKVGVNLTVVAKAMGYESEAVARRYEKHNAVMSNNEAVDIDRKLLSAHQSASA